MFARFLISIFRRAAATFVGQNDFDVENCPRKRSMITFVKRAYSFFQALPFVAFSSPSYWTDLYSSALTVKRKGKVI